MELEIDWKKLDDDVGFRLIKANLLTARKLLSMNKDEIRNATDICSMKSIDDILLVAAETILKPNHVEDTKIITTGCPKIDVTLGGGIHTSGGITELSGESGCGKTQICLQLSITSQFPVQLNGIDKCVLYICTEDNFPSKRLQQLIHYYQRKAKLPYGDRIYIEHLSDVKGLKHCLFDKLPNLIPLNKIGLLIIDSIAALFRSDYSFQDGMQRTKDLRSIGSQLHYLSRKYQLCVLCVNQVSSSLEENINVPALGLAWANLVTTRILLHKNNYSNTRKIELVFSPNSGPASCYYEITETGVHGRNSA